MKERKTIESPVEVRIEMLNEYGYRAEFRASFEVGKSKHPILFCESFDIVANGVVPRDGEKFLFPDLMQSKEFFELFAGASKPEWKMNMIVHHVATEVTVFIMEWSFGERTIEAGGFVVYEHFDTFLRANTLSVWHSSSLMGLICPQQERYERFMKFLAALRGPKWDR